MQIGDILNQQFVLQRHIGQGPRGECWLVHTSEEKEHIYLAKIYRVTQKNWSRLDRIEYESKLLKQLDHSTIPKQFKLLALKNEHSFCLIRDWIPGRNLEQYVEEKRISEQDVLELLQEILESLAYLHGLSPNVLHRNIKPSNIILQPSGAIGLLDFAGTPYPIHFEDNLLLDSYGYSPNAQWAEIPSFASDLYSLGASMIFLLSRHHPIHFPYEQNRIQFEDHINVTPRFLRILQKLISPHDEERFSSTKEVINAVQNCQNPPLRTVLNRRTSLKPLHNDREESETSIYQKKTQLAKIVIWQQNRDDDTRWRWERTPNHLTNFSPQLQPIIDALKHHNNITCLETPLEPLRLINNLDDIFGQFDETGRQWIVKRLHPYDAADILFRYYTPEFILLHYAKPLMERFSLLHTHTINNAIGQWILLCFLEKHRWEPSHLWLQERSLPFERNHQAFLKFGKIQRLHSFLERYQRSKIKKMLSLYPRLKEHVLESQAYYQLCVNVSPLHMHWFLKRGMNGFLDNACQTYPFSKKTTWDQHNALKWEFRRILSWPPRWFNSLFQKQADVLQRLGSLVTNIAYLHYDYLLLQTRIQQEYHWLLPSTTSSHTSPKTSSEILERVVK